MEKRRTSLLEWSQKHWLEIREVRDRNIELEDMVTSLQEELREIQKIKDAENRKLLRETQELLGETKEFNWKLGVSYILNLALLLVLALEVMFFTDLSWSIKAPIAIALVVIGVALTYIFRHQWRKDPVEEEEEPEDLVTADEDPPQEVAADEEEGEEEESAAPEYYAQEHVSDPDGDDLG